MFAMVASTTVSQRPVAGNRKQARSAASGRPRKFVFEFRRQQVTGYASCQRHPADTVRCRWLRLEDGREYLACQPDCPRHGPVALRQNRDEADRASRRRARDRARQAEQERGLVVAPSFEMGDAMATALLMGGWSRKYKDLIDVVSGRYEEWNRTEKWVANQAYKLRA